MDIGLRLPLMKNYCVPSILQGLIEGKGYVVAQEDIARRLTASEFGYRLNDGKVATLLREKGIDYSFFWRNEVPFGEPDFLLGEMNESGGIIGFDKRVYFHKRIEGDLIDVVDPVDVSSRRMDYSDLMISMRKFEDSCFALFGKIDMSSSRR